MYSKADQLHKAKRNNPKKMNRTEYKAKCDYLFERYPVCPYCNVRRSNQIHHTKYGNMGVDKDDRSITPICELCHHDIHHGQKETESKRLEHVKLGKLMHKEWEAHND